MATLEERQQEANRAARELVEHLDDLVLAKKTEEAIAGLADRVTVDQNFINQLERQEHLPDFLK